MATNSGSDAAKGDGPAIELDAEAKELKLAQVKAEARKSIAESQKATLQAQLPSSEIKPLEGAVDAGAGVGLVSQLVAHKLLEPAAKTIVCSVNKALGDSKDVYVLIVEDRALVLSDWPFALLTQQLEVLTGALDRAMGEFESPAEASLLPIGAVLAAPALVGAAASLIGMFRTNYSITSKDVTIGTTPLVAAVASAMLAANRKVRIDQFALLEQSPIIKSFWLARETRLNLESRFLKLKSEKLTPADQGIEDRRAELKAASAAYDAALADPKHVSLGELDKRIKEIAQGLEREQRAAAPDRARIAIAEAVIAQFDAFTVAVTTAGANGAYPPLIAAALRERLHTMKAGSEKNEPVGESHTHVLYVGVAASGGETITRRSLFRASGQVGVMAGAQVSHLLLKVADNSLSAAGTESLLGHLQYDVGKGEVGPLKRVALTIEGA